MKAGMLAALSLLVAAGLPLAARQSAQTPAAPGAASAVQTSAVLLGQVVDAQTGDPVEDARVSLSGRPAPARGRGAPAPADANLFDLMVLGRQGGRGMDRVSADGNGRFVFRDLAAATYSLRAEAPGYVSGSPVPGLSGGLVSVDVDPGQTTARAVLRLWKQAVITGVVVDEAGEPVISARVQAYRRTISRFGVVSYSSESMATTNDRGEYRLAGLTPGDHVVLVPQSQNTTPAAASDTALQDLLSGQMPSGGLEALSSGAAGFDPNAIRVGTWRLRASNVQPPAPRGETLFVYRTIFYPGAATFDAATWLTLGSGEERGGIDFSLQPVPTGRVTGTVTASSGAGRGVPVRLVPAGARRSEGPASLDVASAQTTPEGSFTLLAVPAGQYRAIARREPPPDFAANLPEGLASNPMMQMVANMQRGAARTPLFGETVITVAPGEETAATITATEGVKLTGRVEFDGSRTPAANEVSRASVVVRALDSDMAGSRNARPNAEGVFTVVGLLPGRYTVTTVFPGPGTWVTKAITAAGRDVTTSALVVEGSDVTEVVATLTDHVGSINGTVRREAASGRGAGEPATPSPTLSAVLVPANYAAWSDPELIAERLRFVRVTPEWTFRVPAVLPGEYLVAVIDEAEIDPAAGTSLVQSLASRATRVVVGTGPASSISVPVSSVRR